MKSPFRSFSALVVVVALLGPTFAPLAPAETDDKLLPFDPEAILRPPAPQTGEILAFNMRRISGAQSQMIRYAATAHQRKVAEERARAFVAARRRAIAKTRPPSSPKKAPKIVQEEPKTGRKTAQTSPEKPQPSKGSAKKSEPESTAPPTAAKPEELPRYIAVDTVKDKRASPKAKKVVMIWDTQSETLVGNNIYEVENPPALGAKARFDTYSAEYIGAGL